MVRLKKNNWFKMVVLRYVLLLSIFFVLFSIVSNGLDFDKDVEEVIPSVVIKQPKFGLLKGNNVWYGENLFYNYVLINYTILNVTGNITADNFVGNGSLLTGLNYSNDHATQDNLDYDSAAHTGFATNNSVFDINESLKNNATKLDATNTSLNALQADSVNFIRNLSDVVFRDFMVNRNAIFMGNVTLSNLTANSVNNSLFTIKLDGSIGFNTTDGNGHFSGNVGVGTTVPGSELEVKGRINATRLNISDDAYIGGTLFIDASTGYVSINDATPDDLFDVQGDAYIQRLGVGTTDQTAAMSTIHFSSPGGGLNTAINGSRIYLVQNSDNNEVITGQHIKINSSGWSNNNNYGQIIQAIKGARGTGSTLGLIVTAKKYGNSDATIEHSLYGISVGTTQEGTNPIINSYGIKINDFTGLATNAYSLYTESPTGTITTNNFNIYAQGTSHNYFGGNVGIGTTSPANKLDIVGSGLQRIQVKSDTAAAIVLNDTGGEQFQIDSTGSPGRLNIRYSLSSTIGMVMDANGNIGLGTITPGNTLDVVGTLCVYGGTCPALQHGDVYTGRIRAQNISTGVNAGSTACIGANGELCLCGECT